MSLFQHIRVIEANAIFVLLALVFSSCSSTTLANAKIARTNFHQYLHVGMTTTEFQQVWQSKSPEPVSTDIINYKGDVWDIRVYELYRPVAGHLSYHHSEFVAFRNGKLSEWGTGTIPRALRGTGSSSSNRSNPSAENDYNQWRQNQLLERQTEALERIQQEQSWDNFERRSMQGY